jgi:hypothetical protein
MASQQQSGRAASMARRQMQVNGKTRSAAASAPTRQPNRRERQPIPAANPMPVASQAAAPVAPSFVAPSSLPKPKRAKKSPSRLRRESLAGRGKLADKSKDRQRTQDMLRSAKKVVDAKKGDCGCGGPCCQEAEAKAAAAAVPASSTPAPKGVKAVKRRRAVSASDTGRMQSRARRAAMSGRGKAGLEAHGKGNSSASLARQANPEISARELARVVRETRSKSGGRGCVATATVARRPRNAADAKAKAVSGTKVGHTEKLTGDEAGLCHAGVTGTNYMSAEVFDNFCQGEAPRAALKVEATSTLRGGHVTSGGKVGGSTVMTGIEAGSCRNVTGTEYLGREEFAQCGATPTAPAAKVSTSLTQRGLTVSGPKASRSDSVTGNRKGTCEAVTGTPYSGQEEFVSFCAPEEQRKNRMRTLMPQRAPGAGKDISGLQPGLSGNHLTGTASGACQAVSGTPYVASSEMSSICAASPAAKGESDFPQVIADGAFSVMPTVAPAPEVATAASISAGSVTGGYEGEGSVTGAFSMGKGKVTGTEQSRFGGRSNNVVAMEPKVEKVETASRVTGEGIETDLNITGDDWDRGDHVTGTEGVSARRNPTRRGPLSAMPDVAAKREPQVVRESANVTGGSGGSLGVSAITVSGGARG